MRNLYAAASLAAVFVAVVSLRSAGTEARIGAWDPAGTMAQARSGASAVRLPDGRVLITGGTGVDGALSTAEIFGAAGAFSKVAPMIHPRSQHVSVVLDESRVLVAGGKTQGDAAFSSAEVYDLRTDRWTDVGMMSASRVGYTATLLSDGRVLLAGGQAGEVTHASLEIFDPGSNRFETVSAQLASPRTRHAAALLPNGTVMLAGGFNGSETLKTTDLFDPKAGTVSRGPDLLTPRESFTATGLLDGKVLMAGGATASTDLASAEILDPATMTFSQTGAMTATRRGHLAFLLPNNNRVLLVGGDAQGSSAELFTPWRSTFQATGNLGEGRSDASGAPVGLGGSLVLAGGKNRTLQLDSSRLYRYATIRADRPDHLVGDTVTLTGSGWQPGEKVTLLFQAVPKTREDRSLTVTADPAGNISASEPQEDRDVAGRSTVTAFGASADGQVIVTKASAKLDQCANGTVSAPTTNACGTSNPDGWQSGNVNENSAHYLEGDSVPYRLVMGGLTPGSTGNTVTIQWGTTKAGKHALDYLTSFNRTVGTANPCDGVSGCGSFTTFAIPADPLVTGSGVTPIAGVFTFYGGTITSADAYVYDPPTNTYSGDSETKITLHFTASVSTPVLAWGGHIGARADWGDNAAVNITGSPFHMQLDEINGGGGQQSRSLSAGAVNFPGSITIIKKVPDLNDPQNVTFSFTASPGPLSNFTLVGTQAGNSKAFPTIINFTTYTVTEALPDSTWQIDSSSACVDPNGNSSINPATGVATISLQEGENITCTFVNKLKPATLTVKKHVSNTHGGTKAASDFQLHVKSGGTDVTGSPAAGSESGTAYTLHSGTYVVSENTPPIGYSSAGFTAGNCAADGTVVLAAGAIASCTITNNDSAASLTVIKHVVNDNGGSKAASDFTITVSCGAGSPAPFPGAEAPGTTVSCPAGSYSVSETGPSGYTESDSAGCSGTLANGDSKTCTITNDDKAATLIVKKHMINDNGGTATASDFTMSVTGGTPASFAGSEAGASVTLNAGTITVGETGPTSAYTRSDSADCSGTIANGETKTCTVTNDDKPATLIVKKHVINDNGGTKVASDFTMSVTGGTPSSFAGSEAGTSVTLSAGSVTVGETGPSGYTRSDSAECSGAIANGESRTCTITNDDQAAKLIVIKHVINDNGGTKVASDFTMSVTGGTPSSFAGSEAGTTVTLNAGAITVGESGPTSLYTRSDSADCSGNIANGETKTCTVTNDDKAATLIVKKHVINDNGGTKVASDFTMSVTGGTPSSFAGSEAGTSVTLSAGSVTVGETGPSGYTRSDSAECSGAIANGESRTCTITNDDQAATLIVIKHVINDNGGTKVASDFTMSVTGGTPSSFAGSEAGTTVTLPAGTISVGETGPSGYTQSNSADCSGSIANGETKTCTVTNDDQAPTLVLTKVCAAASDPTVFTVKADNNALTTLTCGGSQTITTLSAGAHTITEDAVTGWNGPLNGWTAPATPGAFTGPDCPGGSVTLVNGQTKNCFVLNVAAYCTPVFSPTAGAPSSVQHLQQSQPVQPLRRLNPMPIPRRR